MQVTNIVRLAPRSGSSLVATSTLITSRRSQLDFGARLVFFAAAPFAIVPLAAVFPVTGALVNIAIALGFFLAGEAVRTRASQSRIINYLFDREIAVSLYYHLKPPRPFAYYAFYPLLFPYWLIQRDARREFWLFKGYTLSSLILLLGSVIYQYAVYWYPELGLRTYAPVVGMTLVAESVLVLWLLMPIATTVIGFHGTRRRGRLYVLLIVALISTGVSIGRLVIRRDPIVSYSTRERVRQRTASDARRARDVQLIALRAAWRAVAATPGAFDPKARAEDGPIDNDGKVDGAPLDRAHDALAVFYKRDEVQAFDLWASPRRHPRLLVLYFEARSGHSAIWVAMRLGGEEVRDAKQLPKGAFAAMRRAAEN